MIELLPLSDSEFQAYIERDTQHYAEENVKAGYWSAAEALDKSREAHRQLLPDGLATKNHYLFKIRASELGQDIGVIWMAAERGAAQPYGFIYDLIIEEPFRHKGYARQAMLALEGQAKELGLGWLALHVFAHNHAARALYEKLGYEVASLNMTKRLGPSLVI